jgi:urease gamma subunit
MSESERLLLRVAELLAFPTHRKALAVRVDRADLTALVALATLSERRDFRERIAALLDDAQ